MTTSTLTTELRHGMDAYRRAANYLAADQLYLYGNPLLKRPRALPDVKRMRRGRRCTPPGQNFIYADLNRIIEKCDLDMINVAGPGRGGLAP